MQENIFNNPSTDLASLTVDIKTWSRELGFQGIGISDANTDMSCVESGLLEEVGDRGRYVKRGLG